MSNECNFQNYLSNAFRNGETNLNSIADDYIALCPDDPNCYIGQNDSLVLQNISINTVSSGSSMQFINCTIVSDDHDDSPYAIKNSILTDCKINCVATFLNNKVINNSPHSSFKMMHNSVVRDCQFEATTNVNIIGSSVIATTFEMKKAAANVILQTCILQDTITVAGGSVSADESIIDGAELLYYNPLINYQLSGVILKNCNFTNSKLGIVLNAFYSCESILHGYAPLIALDPDSNSLIITKHANKPLSLSKTVVTGDAGYQGKLPTTLVLNGDSIEITGADIFNTIVKQYDSIIQQSSFNHCVFPDGITGTHEQNIYTSCMFNTEAITSGNCTVSLPQTNGITSKINNNVFKDCYGPINSIPNDGNNGEDINILEEDEPCGKFDNPEPICSSNVAPADDCLGNIIPLDIPSSSVTPSKSPVISPSATPSTSAFMSPLVFYPSSTTSVISSPSYQSYYSPLPISDSSTENSSLPPRSSSNMNLNSTLLLGITVPGLIISAGLLFLLVASSYMYQNRDKVTWNFPMFCRKRNESPPLNESTLSDSYGSINASTNGNNLDVIDLEDDGYSDNPDGLEPLNKNTFCNIL